MRRSCRGLTLHSRSLTFLLLMGCVGCEEEIARPAPYREVPGAAGPGAPGAGVAATGEGAGSADEPPVVEFQEADFNETERSRDPFRSFSQLFSEQAKSRVKTQREVVLDQYAVDELKLVGIVTRISPPKAMLVDPTGKGHVITRGQFVGRAEIVQGGTSGADYEINWRVERIRDQDVVLVREDPANPDVPSATRVLALRTDEAG
jgi:type IV pilus assembly protein PilP